MSDKDPSKSTQYRWKRDAQALGNQDSGDLTSETSTSSGSGDDEEQHSKRRRTAADGNLNESARKDQSSSQSDNDDAEADGNESAAEQVHPDEGVDLGPDPAHAEEPIEVEVGGEEQEDGDDEDSGEEENDDENEGGVQQDQDQQHRDEVPNAEDEELLNDNGAASSSSSESSESDNEDDGSEDESDSGEEEEGPNEGAADGDVPLYPNARISLIESLVMILTISLRFSLSGECIACILELLEMHCPARNLCKTSLFAFKSFFVEIGRKTLIFHYFCEYCMSELERKVSVCGRCGDNTQSAFFIEIPLIQQLQRLFLRPGFVEQLMYRFDRVKKHADNYEDIYDGAVYREQFENGFLSHVHNISLMWYTDGIQIFKSTKFAVWPLFFSINELRYKVRTLKENTLLCGLWFGKSKPKPNLFLKPFRQTFETFKTDGFRFHVPEGDPITVKAKLLCGTCDLQAKSLFLRSKLYNGYYGCAKCYSRGERAPAGRTTVHVHPFTPAVDVRLRKNNEVIQCARAARNTLKLHVLGIKGLSMLYFLMPDMIRGTGIDIMHQLFLGVCKTVTNLWFDSKFSGELFSCTAMIDIINVRLSSIRPPSFVQRMTRSLSELKLWKAKEYKLFFFMYAVPVLNGLLPNEFLFHHMKLVSAISFLCQESIFPEQVDRSEILLNEYVREFQQLYGLRFMGMNVHLLTHLAECVRELGPLWVCSCFIFENLNGQLVKLIHGPYQAGIQIMSSASLFMSLNLQLELLHPNSVAKQLCLKLMQFGSKFTVAELINQKSCVVGRNAFRRNVPLQVINMMRQQQVVGDGNFVLFFTLRKKGVFYDSADKPESRNRCSKYVMCQNDDAVPIIGEIAHFVRWSQCECNRVCACIPAEFFCVVKVYERIAWIAHQVPNVSIFHQFAVAPSDRHVVLSCDQIESSCFYVKTDVEYLATPINSLEYE